MQYDTFFVGSMTTKYKVQDKEKSTDMSIQLFRQSSCAFNPRQKKLGDVRALFFPLEISEAEPAIERSRTLLNEATNNLVAHRCAHCWPLTGFD
jgi:hypothetical protein